VYMLGGGAEPAWGQKNTGGAGLGPVVCIYQWACPAPWGAVSYGGAQRGWWTLAAKALLSGPSGKGHSCVHLSRVGKRSEVMG